MELGVRGVLAVAVLLRVMHALLIRTTFSPDEYWQCLEVAHRLVFGYGHLTWEWGAGIRSYMHPLLFAAPLRMLQLAGWDSQAAVLYVPKLQQAVLAAGTDVYMYLLAHRSFGPSAARWALLCQLTAWFNAYCLVRTVSSALEALAIVAALYHLGCWHAAIVEQAPQPGMCTFTEGLGRGRGTLPSGVRLGSSRASAAGVGHLRLALLAAGLGVVLRPPSSLFWLPIAMQEVQGACRVAGRLRRVVWATAAMGTAVVAVSCVIDRLFYGRWLFVPWEFAKFNALSGGSAIYGSHAWHWNFSQGLPTVAATLLPLWVFGVYLTPGTRWLAGLALWSATTYSAAPHKEFRFLLPALQLMVPHCGVALAHLASCSGPSDGARAHAPAGIASVNPRGGSPVSSKAAAASGRTLHQSGVMRAWRVGAVACVVIQIPAALYFGLLHQRGTISVLSHLAATLPAYGRDASVLFITPCHATPWRSHLHHPAPLRFLDCSPPGWAPVVECLNQGPSSASSATSTAGSGGGGGGGGGGSSGIGCRTAQSTDGSKGTCAAAAIAGDALRHETSWGPTQRCHLLFNSSAAADPMHRSEMLRFEARPLLELQRLMQPALWRRTGDQAFEDVATSLLLPSHVVLFDHVYLKVGPWLQRHGFQVSRRFSHADFAVDREHEATVLLLENTALKVQTRRAEPPSVNIEL